MIIFITSSFKILGAMKVNNLCLLKLPFKEQRTLQALSNSELPQNRKQDGVGVGQTQTVLSWKTENINSSKESLSKF